MARRFFARWLDPWERAYHRLPEGQRTREDLNLDEAAIRAALESSGIPIREHHIDVPAFRAWRARAEYESLHPDYYPTNREEKTLEHYLAAELAGLGPGQVVIDIASQTGVVGEVYRRLYSVETYQQDLDYPQGLHGRQIGGDAAQMAVPDNFADVMTLHCSFEHFEGTSDTGFIREAGRVLKPGGTLIIAPLYLAQHYAAITYPPHSARRVTFEPDQRIHALRHWQNRFGRFYDVQHFLDRVWQHRGDLAGEILVIANYRDVSPTVYMRYVLVLRKPA
jgi:SAM-dependent methyltransferase